MADTGTHKILWHSVAPFCPTGYGTQTAIFAPKIAALDQYDLAISSGFGLQGYHFKFQDVLVYPGEDWNRTIYQWAKHHGQGEPVTVITLMDVWPLDREIYAELNRIGRVACWCPIDHKPVPPPVLDFLQKTDAIPIAMSRFGEAEMREAGLDPLYVPHGINTQIFVPRDRKEMRDLMNFPDDPFVVGMVANNQGTSPPRKAFSEALMAFSIFQQTHEDAILYMHAESTGFRNGLDLGRMAERFEIPTKSLYFTDGTLMEFGVHPTVLSNLYNSFDVLLHPSYGEGFGIPIIEAQACGTPVIVTDWTSMPELCGAGWKVGGTPYDHAMAEAFWLKPDVDQIIDALEKAYAARGDLDLRAKAREFALHYDADKVMEDYWVPALEQIHRPREVKPLRPSKSDIVVPELVAK